MSVTPKKTENRFKIRDAAASDMQQISDIYAYYVKNSTATFEESLPDAEEMSQRWEAISQQDLPFIVACIDSEVAGYAYAFPYRQRKAYRFTLEESVYIKDGHGGKGLGRGLLQELMRRGTVLKFKQMVAVITNEAGDDHSGHASIALHKACGFKKAGNLEKVGYKFGKWIDTVIMQISL